MGRSLVLFLFFCTLSCVLPRKLYTESTPLITMKRTPCYGECPQYMISIYESGIVLYNGVRFVQNTGCFQSNLNRQQINYIKFLNEYIFDFSIDIIPNFKDKIFCIQTKDIFYDIGTLKNYKLVNSILEKNFADSKM